MNKYAISALATVVLLASVQFGCTKQETTSENQSDVQTQSTQTESQQQEKESPMSAQYRSLTPFGSNAPAITEYTLVRFETTDGNVDMEIYPQAAPNAAKRSNVEGSKLRIWKIYQLQPLMPLSVL